MKWLITINASTSRRSSNHRSTYQRANEKAAKQAALVNNSLQSLAATIAMAVGFQRDNAQSAIC